MPMKVNGDNEDEDLIRLFDDGWLISRTANFVELATTCYLNESASERHDTVAVDGDDG
jgi:hypothetical protein